MPLSLSFLVNAKLNEIKSKTNQFPVSIFYFLFPSLFFLTLLFTRSRSGLIAFTIVDIAFWATLFFLSKRSTENKGLALKSNKLLFIIIHSVFTCCVFFNGIGISNIDSWITARGLQQKFISIINKEATQPKESDIASPVGPALETGGTESGEIRKYVWQGAINAWRSSPKTFLIGTGTETFAWAFYGNKPIAHNLTSEWDFLYNKAHNEYLNFLATTGIFGLVSYLFFIGSFIYICIQMIHDQYKKLQKEKHNLSFDIRHLTLVIGIFMGWLSLLITNFFGFSVVITQLFFFLFPAAILIFTHDSEKARIEKSFTMNSSLQKKLLALITGITSIAIAGVFLFWYADVQFAKGYRLNKAGQYAQGYAPLLLATTINPLEPLYHDEYAIGLSALALAAATQEDATLAGTLAKRAITENEESIRISPNNVNFWKSKTKILYALADYNPSFRLFARDALITAEKLSPMDPKILYNLAIIVGQSGNIPEAIGYLKKAIEIKQNYRDAYYALYIFYNENKKPTEARQIIETYLNSVDSFDEEFKKLVE